MSTLIILQCSGTKCLGGNHQIVNDPFSQQLEVVRNHLINNHNIVLDGNMLMPAYLRYGAFLEGNEGGRLYTHMDWHLALQLIAQGHLKILIISALFGLLEYDTSIPFYNLEMTQAKRRWKQNNVLANTLENYLVMHPEITNMKSFLSDSYYDVVRNIIPYESNQWIRYDRGANVADNFINPFLQNL